MSTNDTLQINPQYFRQRQSFGMPNYIQSNPNMFDYGTQNAGGSYYDQQLVQKQSFFGGAPLLQMYQSGVLDKKSLLMMSLMSGDTSNVLEMMKTLNIIDAEKREIKKHQQYQAEFSRMLDRSSGLTSSELEDALNGVEHYRADGTSVASKYHHKKRADKEVDESDSSVLKKRKTEEVEEAEATQTNDSEEFVLGGTATGMAIGHAFYKNATKNYLSEKDLLKYEKTYNSGSDIIKSTKGVKAHEAFNNFEIKGKKVDASDWLKHIETKSTHFKELNNGKGYTLDELRALKNPPEKVTKFLNQVDEAEKIRINKREAYTPKDEANMKSLESRNTAYSEMETAQSKVKNLKEQIKNAKGSDKVKLQDELKVAKKDLGQANKEFKQASKEFEKLAKEQSKANIQSAKILEAQTSGLIKKLKKAKTEAGMKDVLNKTLQEAKIAKNTNMIKTCEELLLKEPKNLLSSCKGVAENAKGFTVAAEEAGKNLSKLSKAKGILGKAALPVAIAFEGFDIYSAYGKSTKAGNKQVVKSAAGLGGAIAAGALSAGAIGAAVGTVVPVAGNIVGGAVGLILGCAVGAVGYWLGSKGGEVIADEAFGEDDPEPAK